jgi:hypothetical protein
MPNISDVPIDSANVNWLYVIVLSVIVFFSTPALHIGFPRRGDVGPGVWGRLRVLYRLSARPAAADISHRPKASSSRSSRSAAALAVGTVALRALHNCQPLKLNFEFGAASASPYFFFEASRRLHSDPHRL